MYKRRNRERKNREKGKIEVIRRDKETEKMVVRKIKEKREK